MEFCAGGDLAGYIHRCKRVPEVTACAVMRQLGAGLKELWSRHMVHVSISPVGIVIAVTYNSGAAYGYDMAAA